MKSYRKEIWLFIDKRRDFINITSQVENCVEESGIKEGLCLVNPMHITASVFINDDEKGLHQDFERWLEKLAPEKPYSQYAHNGFEFNADAHLKRQIMGRVASMMDIVPFASDNADAHLKRQIMGREVVVAVTNGRLDLGTWEQIFYGEFDGKRRKRVLVKIIGE